MRCPCCESDNPEGTKFCGERGTPLTWQTLASHLVPFQKNGLLNDIRSTQFSECCTGFKIIKPPLSQRNASTRMLTWHKESVSHHQGTDLAALDGHA
jgi:hypothetical protein